MRLLLQTLTLVLTLSYISDLNSQNYRPMAVEGASWRYEGWGDFGGSTTSYFIQGDTIVNGMAYKNLYQDGFLAGFIRDDTLNRKVYMSQPSGSISFPFVPNDSLFFYLNQPEILLADFSLELLDSLNIYSYPRVLETQIKKIETKEIFGEQRTVWSFFENITSTDNFNLVEGIGSLDGFLGVLSVVKSTGGGIFLADYCISDTGRCTTSTSSPPSINLKYHPNPTRNFLTLDTEEDIQAHNVYSINGQAVNVTRSRMTFDVSQLPSGYYTLSVVFKNQSTEQIRFLKI